jgi:hypothetical protein
LGAAPAFFFYGRFHGENHHFQRPAGSVCAIHARRHGHPQTLRATARRPRSPSPRVAGPVAGQSRRERLLSLGRSGPGVRSGFLETPRARFGGVFLAFGGPRAGETGGGSGGSPRCARTFRIGPGSVMNAMSRMSPPHPGHATGNSSPTRAISFAHAIREVLWEGGLSTRRSSTRTAK